MASWNLLILALNIAFIVVLSNPSCSKGFNLVKKKCIDYDECEVDEDYPDYVGPCGEKANCFNTNGSFYCQCFVGYRSSTNTVKFAAETSATCKDINECVEITDLCGPNTKCLNTIPHYSCICNVGFISTTGVKQFQHSDNVTCIDVNECKEGKICGHNATCINTLGSYYCVCNAGFGLKSHKANFTGNQEQCEALNYDVFNEKNVRELKGSNIADELGMQLKKSCTELTQSENPSELDDDDSLKRLLSVIDNLLSRGVLSDNRKVSTFLDMVENALKLVGPSIKPPGTRRSSTYADLEMVVHKGGDLPKGAVTLSSKQALLNIQLETAAGDQASYPGFTTVSLLSYANLEDSADGFFRGMKKQGDQRYQINSKVVTAAVSRRNTSYLEEPVKLTLFHLKKTNESSHTCVFWDSSEEEGAWSPRGCSVSESNPEYTVCSCNHLSSFAVLMALYDIEDKFELQLITWVGLSLSLLCLFICILTFAFVRSIQSQRTTIHLHLCISLFTAILVFLVGISQTENRVGCAVVAGLLHFFYLAGFCWMCLEGIQLFRMVVLVFNTNYKTLYMLAGGYGVPAVIVGISALFNAKGYGTEKYCWLNLEFIWSFFGPACVIIVINIFFFLITVWKLAQKFSSLNPDLNKLQKIKAFTITAVAQLCVLGTTWIFGCFQFEENTIVMSYLFTIFGSLQGLLIFVMHCLFSKQVREEYGNILSRLCTPRKKRYSEFGYSQSSKAHASKSTQDTGESQM